MRRILIADDSALVRKAIEMALEGCGFEFGHADNGAAALAALAAEHWDLLLLDVIMPVMDGPAALQVLRKQGDTTPVVLVTSVSTAATVSRALRLGNVRYLAKPFTPAQLVEVVLRTLRLDAASLPPPPRVLMQQVEPELAARLVDALPPHVQFDHAARLAEALDHLEAHPPGLVLLDPKLPLEEVETLASVLRAHLPAAGIFALVDDATAGAPWHPGGALDGVLPRRLDRAYLRDLLYPLYVRPLVSVEGAVLRAAGFRGSPDHHPAYVAALSRHLVDAAMRTGLADVELDLRHVPGTEGELIALVRGLNETLRAVGLAPGFRLSRANRCPVAAALPRTLLIAA